MPMFVLRDRYFSLIKSRYYLKIVNTAVEMTNE